MKIGVYSGEKLFQISVLVAQTTRFFVVVVQLQNAYFFVISVEFHLFSFSFKKSNKLKL